MNASYVIVHGGAEPSRLRNLHFLLGHLRGSAFEIIVVEQDTTPRLRVDAARVRHVFSYNPGRFNRAWGFNVGAKLASRDVLICSDNDVLIPDTTPQALRRVDRLVIPYRRCLDLSAEATRALHATGVVPDGAGSPRPASTVGGAFIVATKAFLDIGGICEDFEGWGAEDDAFYDKCVKTIGVLRSTSFVLYHMHHERAAPGPDDRRAYDRNVRLLRRELAKTAAQLRASAAAEIGDPQKYIKRAILKARRPMRAESRH